MTTGHCPLCGAVGNRIFPTSLMDALPGAITPARARELIRIAEKALFQALTKDEGLHARKVQLNLPLGHGFVETIILIDWLQG